MNRYNESGRHQTESSAANTEKKKSRFVSRMAKNMGYETNESSPSAAKKTKKTVRITFIIIICILLLLIVCVAAFLLWSRPPEVADEGLIIQTTAEPTSTPEPVPNETPAPTPEPTPTPIPAIRNEDTYTLLVVGRDLVGLNTDTILIARMDCREKSINVVSLPRDTLVNVDWPVKKLNSVYGALSTEGFLNEVENLVGFDIDNYVIVNPYIFSQVIDCVGGIWYEVPFGMYYTDPDQDLYINLDPGYQLLNGNQCEQLVRYRSGYPNGDLGRIQTQQSFLRAAAKQILSLGNISNLSSIVSLITEYTDTNLTAANIAFYAEEFLKMGTDGISFFTLPADEVYINGGSYVSIRLDDWLNMINACLNPWNLDVTEQNLDVITYNGSSFYSTTGHYPEGFYDYSQVVE